MNTDTYYLIDILKVHPSYAESSKKVHLAGSLIPILNFSIFLVTNLIKDSKNVQSFPYVLTLRVIILTHATREI